VGEFIIIIIITFIGSADLIRFFDLATVSCGIVVIVL